MPLDPHSASKEMDYWKRARGRGGDRARAWMYRDKCIQTHTAVCWAPWGGPRGSAFMISIEGERRRLLVNRWKDSCSFPSSLAHPLITSLMIQLIHFLRISHGSLPISSHCLPPPARPIPGDLYWVLDSWSLFSGGLQARLITPRSPINSVQQHPHSLSLSLSPNSTSKDTVHSLFVLVLFVRWIHKRHYETYVVGRGSQVWLRMDRHMWMALLK